MREEWRPVVGYEGYYEVSNMGRVRSITIDAVYRRNGLEYTRKRRGRILKQQNASNGYLQVHLSKDGEHKIYRVRRIVANAFIDNPDNLPEVNHKDENKKNNRVANLEWCTHSYNNSYGSAPSFGEKNGMARLTSVDVAEIRRRRKSGEILRTIAEDYGISLHHVSNIARGVRWKYEPVSDN